MKFLIAFVVVLLIGAVVSSPATAEGESKKTEKRGIYGGFGYGGGIGYGGYGGYGGFSHGYGYGGGIGYGYPVSHAHVHVAPLYGHGYGGYPHGFGGYHHYH